MANMIKFYRGLLANLPATGDNGALYITTDEGAIYYGTGTGMKRLGDYIMVDAVANLPTDGANATSLYYCVAENILCRYDAEKGWIQINKQPTSEELKTLLSLKGMAYKSEVAETDLNAELAAKINASTEANHSHDNKTVLDGITADKVAAWDASEKNAKDHADGLNTAMNTRVEALEAIDHSHSFVESELNKIADGDVAKWNAVVADHLTSADKTTLENSIKEAKKAGTDANTNIETYKVTNDARVLAVEEDIAEIVDGTNGILAQAKSYVDGKDSAMNTRVAALETAAPTHALKTEVEAVDAKFANYNTTVAQKAIDDAQDAEIAKKVDKVEGKSLISDSEITRLAGMSTGANKVEASETNGKIKIDGVDTVVYTHPEKHSISEVDGLQDALAAALKAGTDAQSDVDALEELVGVLPEGTSATTVVDYIDNLGAYVDDLDAYIGGLPSYLGTFEHADFFVEAGLNVTVGSTVNIGMAWEDQFPHFRHYVAIEEYQEQQLPNPTIDPLGGAYGFRWVELTGGSKFHGVFGDVEEVRAYFEELGDNWQFPEEGDMVAISTSNDDFELWVAFAEYGVETLDMANLSAGMGWIRIYDKKQIAKIDTKADKSVVDAKFADYRTSADQDVIDNGHKERLEALEAKFTGDDSVADQIAAAVNAEKERAEEIEEALATDVGDLMSDFEEYVETNDARVKAIEDNYLKDTDKKDLQDQITANANAITAITDGIDPDKIDGLTDLVNWADEHAPEVASIKEDIETNAQAIADEKTRAEAKEGELATAIETAKTEASNQDAVVLAEAQKYADDKAAELADGVRSSLQDDIDANRGAIEKLNGADTVDGSVAKSIKDAIAAENLGQYAKTADLGDLAALDTITHEKVTDFDTAVAAVKVAEATKATQDGNGKVIADTYAEKATTLAGYGIGDAYTKTETYTQAEVDALIAAAHTWGEF